VLAILAFTAAACGGGATSAPTTGTGASAPAASAPAASAPAASAGGSAAASGGGGSAGACAAAPSGATATVTISIKNFAYAPAPAQAKVGDVVAWKNEDSAPHSATMDDGACDTDTISQGATAMLVFSAPGTYTYHCKIHPAQMKDVVIEVK
jgi:plastocyanin